MDVGAWPRGLELEVYTEAPRRGAKKPFPGGIPRLPKGVVPKPPGLKGRPPAAIPPSSGLPPPASSPLKRLLRKAIPPPKGGGKGSLLQPLKSTPAMKRPAAKPFKKAEPSVRTPSTKPSPATRTPLLPRFKPRTFSR